MKLVNPVVEPVVVPGALAPRLDTFSGKTVGLWANMKLNAVELLDQVERVLRSRYALASVVRGSYSPARVMRTNEWPRVDECDVVVLTHGD